MRYMPLLVFALITAALYFEQAIQQDVTPAQQVISSGVAATAFVNYRSAVMAYMSKYPHFTGSISSSTLTALTGQQFSSTFLASTGNAETTVGSGVEVTVYSALPTGALSSVLMQSGNDASIGLSSGSTWTTGASGVVTSPQPLAVPVPSGDVVSVVEIGT
jgi:hypothetical protein